MEVLKKLKCEVNFKKVIWSKYWSSGKSLDLEDLPSIKFTEVGNLKEPKRKARTLVPCCYALHEFLAHKKQFIKVL